MAWTSSAGKRGIVLEKILAVIMATLLVVAMGGCASSGATIDDEPTPMADTAGDVEADESGDQNDGTNGDPVNKGESDSGEDGVEGSGGNPDASGETGNSSPDGNSGDNDALDDGQSGNSNEPNLVEQEISKIDRIMRLAAEGRVASVSTFEELKAAVEADAELIVVKLEETVEATETIDIESGKNITITGGILTRSSQNFSIFTVEEGASLTLENVRLEGTKEKGADGGNSSYASAVATKGTLNLTKETVVTGFVAANGGGLSVLGGTTTIDGASVSNNIASASWKAKAYGGGIYLTGGELLVKKGAVQGNKALCHDAYSRSTASFGGGIAVVKGKATLFEGSLVADNAAECTEKNGNTECRDGGGVFVGKEAEFVLDGGTIKGNKARHSGGGICVSIDGRANANNDQVHLISGEISGNTASTGGGMYIAEGSALQLVDAAITENVADDGTHWTGMGGGLWSCGVGQTYSTSTAGCFIYGNTSVKKGQDIHFDSSWYNGLVHQLARYYPSGEKIDWAQVPYEQTNKQGWFSSEYGTESIADINEYLSNWHEENALYGNDAALKVEGSSELTSSCKLLIKNNTATSFGGGIAYNGLLVMGEDKDISLTVNKAWEGVDEAAQPESIRVDLYKGDKSIDTLELTKENGWTYTVNGLPEGNDYRVEEQKIDGFSATYNEVSLVDAEKRAYEVTITNKSAGGDLRITKAWADTAAEDMAKNGTATAIFRVTGYATQAEAEAGEGAEIYRNLVALTFNDPATQERVLTGLPLGFYIVQEVGYEGDNLDDEAVAANRTVIEVSATDTDPAEASFTNRHSNEHVFGTSVVNTYEASPNNGIVFRNQDPLYRELHGTVA